MEILIFTDDTGVKLPAYNKWKSQFSSGIDIRKDPTIKSRLSEYKIDYPTNDSENELLYVKVLNDLIRPANQMFAGMFSEVRHFSQTLSLLLPTKIYFISGRYGLISEHDEIIPYYFLIETVDDVKNADKKFNFIGKIQKLLSSDRILIFLLPKHYIEYLIEKKFFNEMVSKSQIIIVSSDEYRHYFAQFQNILFLRRKGVARIGSTNREIIIKIVKDIVQKQKK